jgi:aminomethyltransferase
VPETPLRSAHEDLGARFTDFGGWEMPLSYEGVIAEHMSVRQTVGVFDVTHLGRFRVTGSGATELVRSQLCNDIAKVGAGRAQYTMALNEAGGVVDDIIVWRFADDEYWIMPNGVNFDELLDRFAGQPDSATTAVQSETVLLAVQGPDSSGLIERTLGVVPGRFRVVTGEFEGMPFWAAGTGYTGERGTEIAVPNEKGEALLARILDSGAAPCGLGARDTLRLEMGFPLWGQDLDEDTTPLEAGLGWVVEPTHEFVGRKAILAQQVDGLRKQLVGFKTEDRRPPRQGYRLRCGDSEGTVTSGNFSPVLGVGIGMGYLSPVPDPDAVIQLEIRGEWREVERVDPPFLER